MGEIHVPLRGGEKPIDIRLSLGLENLGRKDDALIPKIGQQSLDEFHIVALPVILAEDHDAVIGES